VNHNVQIDGIKRLAEEVLTELESLEAVVTANLPTLVLARVALAMERARPGLLKQREAVLACKASLPSQS
jgi:hypothetical protein